MEARDRTSPVPQCPHCSKPMQLVRTLPRLGGAPELRTFRCQVCGAVETEPTYAARCPNA